MSETPEFIYLQTGGGDPADKFSELDPERVTWCADWLEPDDAKYVRADVVERELSDLRAKLAAAEKDAERYRFLKRVLTVHHAMQSFLRHNNLSPDTKWEPNMDAAIDAAIEKERGNG